MTTTPSGSALILTYVALIVLAVASWIAASLGTGTVVALAIALVFMELISAHSVDRVIAVVAVSFVVLLCVGALGDVAFR